MRDDASRPASNDYRANHEATFGAAKPRRCGWCGGTGVVEPDGHCPHGTVPWSSCDPCWIDNGCPGGRPCPKGCEAAG